MILSHYLVLLFQSASPLTSVQEDPLEDLTRELIILLDPQNDTCSDAGDWMSLAEKMGCGITRIRWLGTQTSKTRLLVEKWLEEKRTFTELRDILRAINRPDAAVEVEKRLHVLEPDHHPNEPLASMDENHVSVKSNDLNDLGSFRLERVSERKDRCRSVNNLLRSNSDEDANNVDDCSLNIERKSAVENTDVHDVSEYESNG